MYYYFFKDVNAANAQAQRLEVQLQQAQRQREEETAKLRADLLSATQVTPNGTLGKEWFWGWF